MLDAGVEPLYDPVATQFQRVAMSSVGLDFFSWWTSFRSALWQEFGAALLPALAQAAARLEYAMLCGCLIQRGVTLRDYLLSGRHGIDLGFVSSGLKGRAVDEFLASEPNPHVATAIVRRITVAEYHAQVTAHTSRCLLHLSGSPQQDMAALKLLAAGLDGAAPHCEWILHGNNTFTTVEALRQFWQELQSITYANGRSPTIQTIIDPLADAVATSNATLGGFVEWPERPQILAGKPARSPDGLRRIMDIGYRGIFVTPDAGPVDLILRACLIRARQLLEPVAQWTIQFADDTFPPGELQSTQFQLIELFQ